MRPWLIGLLLLATAGCVPLYLAYPTVDHVAAVDLTESPEEVHAFRVDVLDQTNCIDVEEHDRYTLSPLSLKGKNRVPGQTQVALDSAWIWHCIALCFEGQTKHRVLVRLYRRGYHTITLSSAEPGKPLVWQPAHSAREQEQAIDDLLATWQTDRTLQLYQKGEITGSDCFRRLAPGSTSASHRAALAFAIEEYQALCDRVGKEEEALKEKIAWLRDRRDD